MSPFATTLVIALALAATLRAAGEQGELVLREDFDSPASLSNWSLDGLADVSVTPEGKLRIKTEKREVRGQITRCSVLWCKQPVWGDLRIEFDCKAEPKSRCLFFFSARTTEADRSVFAWPRPRAEYGDYAYEPRIELYSMGILRSDQTELNLRHLGGSDVTQEFIDRMPYHPLHFPDRWLTTAQLAECMKAAKIAALPDDPRELAQLMRRPPFKQAIDPHVARYKEIWQRFQDVSVLARHHADRPVFGDAEKWYHVAVTVRGARVVVQVDGQTILDHLDSRRAKAPLAGGYFAFRNFVPTEAQYDNVRVYRLPK